MADEKELGWVLDPEAFPLYYSGSSEFTIDGQASGAVGAEAQVTRELNNFPHIFYGVRVRNLYPLPNIDLREQWLAVKQLDADQTVRIELAQQNVTAQATVQDLLVGGLAGAGGGTQHWHPFPKPYLFAGGNEVNVIVRRLTAYPDLDEQNPVRPTLHVTLVTSVHRAEYRSVPPQRIQGGNP